MVHCTAKAILAIKCNYPEHSFRTFRSIDFNLFEFSSTEPLKDAGCVSNSDCSPLESCQNRNCVNPCTNGNPCSRTAECRADNHRAVCTCPVGYIGDPFVNCYVEPIVQKPECQSDNQCPTSKACINQLCRDPCADRNPCIQNAECRTIQHHPTCVCPVGWAGDPQIQCYKRKYFFS